MNSNNRQSQSDHVCRMIAQEMIEPLVQFLNIIVTDTEGTETSSDGMFCSNFEGFEGINSMIDQNRYIQIEPSKGVYYNSPLKSRKLNKPTRMVPTIESSRAYLHHRLIDELMKYRDLSFDNKGGCRDVYWDGQNGTSLNSDFQKFGGETIGADKIFWNKYKVNFPLLSLMNRIFNNMPTT